MESKNLYLTYGIFVASAMVFLFLMLTGCSPEPVAEIDLYPNMPSELRNMQGSWVDANTNDTVECTAVIQGYTIRVRFQEEPEGMLQKQNASIDKLDEQRNLIVLNGGTGAWPYEFIPEAEKDRLKIEFFASDGWHQTDLFRAD